MEASCVRHHVTQINFHFDTRELRYFNKGLALSNKNKCSDITLYLVLLDSTTFSNLLNCHFLHCSVSDCVHKLVTFKCD